ncbi:hypothetical protein PRIPAC_92980, partial [Pristionchus pacificus]
HSILPSLSTRSHSSSSLNMSKTGTGSKETVNRKREKPSAPKEGRRKKSVEDVEEKPKKGGDEKTVDEKTAIANKKAWAKKLHNLNCKEMSMEFNAKMKRFMASGVTINTCKTDANQLKNRYADVVCIDQTRVTLKNRGKDDDFIHANWVGGPAPGATKYICTQAPLKETQEDFWHMCFTEKVSLILMLCNFTEGSDMEKCSHYFPEKPKEKIKFGPYTVTMKEKLDELEIEDTDFSLMEIKWSVCNHLPYSILSYYSKDETVKVKHCFMRYWVDNCAPVETEPILKLWRWVRKYHNDRPVVVHCSAGVGRTSTFVGIELASHRIASNPDIHMLDIVKELRKQRYQSVQAHVQFLYLHYLVLDYFVQEKIADAYDKQDSKFVKEYRKHAAKRTTRAKKQSANQKQQPEEDDSKPEKKRGNESNMD